LSDDKLNGLAPDLLSQAGEDNLKTLVTTACDLHISLTKYSPSVHSSSFAFHHPALRYTPTFFGPSFPLACQSCPVREIAARTQPGPDQDLWLRRTCNNPGVQLDWSRFF
jgi:hypothetical protein